MHRSWVVVFAALLFASHAAATTITLSTVSSDGTPASQLDATLEFSVTGATELTLTVTNTGSDFNINEIYFNAESNVTGLSLDSATHSVEGDVATEWGSVLTNTAVDGFGSFDFGLADGVGETDPSVIEPGEDVVFVFTISGTGPFAMDDFKVANGSGFEAAAKFVNGPPDPECADAVIPTEKCPEGVNTEDSAFGAVPEPLVGWLVALGLAGVVASRRTSR